MSGGYYMDPHGHVHPNKLTEDYVPVVVISPEDREQVERLEAHIRAANGWNRLHMDRRTDALQTALREFASPAPPKPDHAVGTVVEASAAFDDGKGFGPAKWAATEDGSWTCLTDGHVGTALPWPFLKNVRVLSEGVS